MTSQFVYQYNSALLSFSLFRQRHAVQIENSLLRLTITREGGHIAELFHKSSAVSPLWIPPWPSMEPSKYSREHHPEYGNDAESKLLSGIMGHNLCLHLFGPPSPEEAAAGVTVHGEASTALYEFESFPDGLRAHCQLPLAQLSFEREIWLRGSKLEVRETVESLSAFDQPIAWQQHVTLGPPFIERGSTQFRTPVARAAAFPSAQEFEWPFRKTQYGEKDLRTYTNAEQSDSYTAQLMQEHQPRSYAFAFSPRHKLVIGYVWQTADFPWLGMWEENGMRQFAPWGGRTQTLGLEFGVSPFPEGRRAMITRGTMFETPVYRWLPARSRASVSYYAGLVCSEAIPESLEHFEEMIR